jgi:hypothetical protein
MPEKFRKHRNLFDSTCHYYKGYDLRVFIEKSLKLMTNYEMKTANIRIFWTCA